MRLENDSVPHCVAVAKVPDAVDTCILRIKADALLSAVQGGTDISSDPRRGLQPRSTIKVLPRRPGNLNTSYIAANAEALCSWLYALGSMHLAPCVALCTRLYALGSVHLALCTMHSAQPDPGQAYGLVGRLSWLRPSGFLLNLPGKCQAETGALGITPTLLIWQTFR